MKELGTDDPAAIRRAGAIDLPTVQRYLNFWFSSSLDLFGAEVSSNAATYFANGIKGRPDEPTYEDHVAKEGVLAVERPEGEGAATEEVPLRNAMNEVTRGAYIRDCEIGVKRWNRLIARAGFPFELELPSPHFRRAIGFWAGVPADPAGRIIPAAEWQRLSPGWVPSEADRAFVKGLMQRVTEPGRMAAWIAPPDRGINNLPVEYEYVHLH
jgi:benzoyl-CoA 2,3-dioxygenase component B